MNSIRARFHPRDTTGKSARVRRVTHGNKLATVLTTVQADICDGKLWAKVKGKESKKHEEERRKRKPRERDKEYKVNLVRSTEERGGTLLAEDKGRADSVHVDEGTPTFISRIISFVSSYSN